MGPIRTFIAVETPAPIRQAIAELQSALKETDAQVRWEPPEKFHATVKFLGDVDERNLPTIIAKIEQSVSVQSCFEMRYEGLGTFPEQRPPRIIWLGCHNPDGKLLNIKNTLDALLLPIGFPVDDRPFHPHITLGRLSGNRGTTNLLSKMETLTFVPRSTPVERIVVMKSMLKPQGSEYSQVASIPLSRTS